MEKKIVWNERALIQLNEIYEYIREDSSINAEKVKDKIVEKIEGLPLNPEVYPPDKFKKNNKSKKYRAFNVYQYRISYYVKKEKIIIIRIRHTAMSPLRY